MAKGLFPCLVSEQGLWEALGFGGWQLLHRENSVLGCTLADLLPPPPPLQLDHCLQEDFPIYKSFRFKGSIGPLRLHLVGAGAFARLRAAMGCPVPMPRVLREERLLAVIQGTVIS